MKHLLKMFNDAVIELQGLTESQFYIFRDEDREALTHLWHHNAGRNPNTFVSLLSPEQKDRVSLWTFKKVNIPVDDAIRQLILVLDELRGVSSKCLVQRSTTQPQGAATAPSPPLYPTLDVEEPKKSKRSRDRSRARLKSGIRSLKNIVLVPETRY